MSFLSVLLHEKILKHVLLVESTVVNGNNGEVHSFDAAKWQQSGIYQNDISCTALHSYFAEKIIKHKTFACCTVQIWTFVHSKGAFLT